MGGGELDSADTLEFKERDTLQAVLAEAKCMSWRLKCDRECKGSSQVPKRNRLTEC